MFYGAEAGAANKAGKIRWDQRHGVVMTDDGAIPSEKVFRRRLSCSQKHPGLCLDEDSNIYDQALLVGADIEHAYTDRAVYQFHRWEGTDRAIVVFRNYVSMYRPFLCTLIIQSGVGMSDACLICLCHELVLYIFSISLLYCISLVTK
jgi:hypothetical protein